MTHISPPPELRQLADALSADISMILRPSSTAWTTYDLIAGNDDRPSLDAQIARAKRTLAELQMAWRGVLKAERERIRASVREAERMVTENARVMAERERESAA